MLQPVRVPNQQKNVRQQHERNDARSIEPRRMRQHEDVQNNWKVKKSSQKRCSWDQQQDCRNPLADANEGVIETRQGQRVEIVPQWIIRWKAGEPLTGNLYESCWNESESQSDTAKNGKPAHPPVSSEVAVHSI